MIFEYRTTSAYRDGTEEESSIAIYNRDFNNVVLTNYYNETKSYTINENDMDTIFEMLLKDENLYSIKELPGNPVLDGIEEHFYFSNGIKEINLVAFNTNYYLDKDKAPEEIYIVLNIFYKIAEILRKYKIKLMIER